MSIVSSFTCQELGWMGAPNWQFKDLWVYYVSRKTTKYSSTTLEHVITYFENAKYEMKIFNHYVEIEIDIFFNSAQRHLGVLMCDF